MSSRKKESNPVRADPTLLERLLDLIRQGSARTIVEVSQELAISPALVETMLEDLSRRGYLHPLQAQCPRRCAGCAQAGRCAVGGAGRVWQMESCDG